VHRVCANDRPGTTLNDDTQTESTPVQQPTTAQHGVGDLHAVLIASREAGPYVLVAHSWGGLIARLFASTYPDEVAGLGAGRLRLGVSEELSDACAMGDVH